MRDGRRRIGDLDIPGADEAGIAALGIGQLRAGIGLEFRDIELVVGEQDVVLEMLGIGRRIMGPLVFKIAYRAVYELTEVYLMRERKQAKAITRADEARLIEEWNKGTDYDALERIFNVTKRTIQR